jgi:hypothetical protein
MKHRLRCWHRIAASAAARGCMTAPVPAFRARRSGVNSLRWPSVTAGARRAGRDTRPAQGAPWFRLRCSVMRAQKASCQRERAACPIPADYSDQRRRFPWPSARPDRAVAACRSSRTVKPSRITTGFHAASRHHVQAPGQSDKLHCGSSATIANCSKEVGLIITRAEDGAASTSRHLCIATHGFLVSETGTFSRPARQSVVPAGYQPRSPGAVLAAHVPNPIATLRTRLARTLLRTNASVFGSGRRKTQWIKQPPSVPSLAESRSSCWQQFRWPRRSPDSAPFAPAPPALAGFRDRSAGFCHRF